jgi:hypothetical protein
MGAPQSVPSKYPGLNLKAWAVFSGAAGGISKASNVTSVTRGGVGNYVVVFPAGVMATANYTEDGFTDASGGVALSIQGNTKTTTGCNLSTKLKSGTSNPSAADSPGSVYVEFWE